MAVSDYCPSGNFPYRSIVCNSKCWRRLSLTPLHLLLLLRLRWTAFRRSRRHGQGGRGQIQRRRRRRKKEESRCPPPPPLLLLLLPLHVVHPIAHGQACPFLLMDRYAYAVPPMATTAFLPPLPLGEGEAKDLLHPLSSVPMTQRRRRTTVVFHRGSRSGTKARARRRCGFGSALPPLPRLPHEEVTVRRGCLWKLPSARVCRSSMKRIFHFGCEKCRWRVPARGAVGVGPPLPLSLPLHFPCRPPLPECLESSLLLPLQPKNQPTPGVLYTAPLPHQRATIDASLVKCSPRVMANDCRQ